MNVIVLGSTGMVGKGVLLECLEDPQINKVLVINRRPVGIKHPKLTEIIQGDLLDLSNFKHDLSNQDACFFCLGTSSVGMSEAEYKKVTYDLTLGFAQKLLSFSDRVVFCYVSGAGTDGSAKGRIMWARIKGMTENALLSLPFRKAYMFRPGYIQPIKGVKSTSKIINIMYFVFTPLYYVVRGFGSLVTDSVSLGKAMIKVARDGYHKNIIEMKDIDILSKSRA